MQTEYNSVNSNDLFMNVARRNELNNNNKEIERRPRSSGFKSFLQWFKKIESSQKANEEDDASSVSSLSDEYQDQCSVSSTSSTATVESFAFLPANVYKPYGDASQPEKYISSGPYTETYHRLIKERNIRRHLDKNLSLRKKYSLYSSGTIKKKTNDNYQVIDPHGRGKNEQVKVYDTFSLPAISKQGHNHIDNIINADSRKTASLSTKGNKNPCHVKGKRKAPLPPVNSELSKTLRKKRQAPAPPDLIRRESDKTIFLSENHKACDYQNGITNSDYNSSNMPIFKCDFSPKPWFKRQSNEPKTKLKNESKKKGKHDFPEVGFFRCTRIFESKKQSDNVDEKSEKRLSCFLPNISELDREAAEILKQKRQLEGPSDSNTPGQNYNKPSTARDLISKFNALTSNVSKRNELNDKFIKKSTEISTDENVMESFKTNREDIIQAKDKNETNEVIKKCTACFSSIGTNISCAKCNTDLTKTLIAPNIMKSDSYTSFQTEVFTALSKMNYPLDVKIEDLSKPSSTNDAIDEKTRLKEMLKEMKNSLTKRPKPTKKDYTENKDLIDDAIIVKAKAIEMNSPVLKKSIFNTNQINNIAEKYKNKPSDEIATDEGKTKNLFTKDKSEQNIRSRETNKVSSSAQTNCSVNQNKVEVGKPKIFCTNQNDLYMNCTNEEIKDKDILKNEKEENVNIKIVLKQLEAAIADGNHELAAKLAKDLALLKVKCSVTTTSSPPSNKIKSIQIYIEDQFSHQGPIPVNVDENIKMIELKEKVFEEFHIPVGVQKWIVKKQLAVDEKSLLKEYNNGDFNEPLFLYVVSHDIKKPLVPTTISTNTDNNQQNTATEGETSLKKIFPSTSSQINAGVNLANDKSSNSNNTAMSLTTKLIVTSPGKLNTVKKKTWSCADCTLVNSLLSPICSACGSKKIDNKIHENTNSNKRDETTGKNEHYLQLINLDNSDLVSNKEEFECSVCLNDFNKNSGVVLRECLHTFCKECLGSVIKYCEEVEVKCPYRDKDYFCDSVLQEREIKALVCKTEYEKHLAKSINVAENKTQNAFHCKTPNCKGWCIFEENVNDFNCPICRKRNCLTCQAIHDGKNCKEYQQIINNADENSSNEVQRTKKMLDEMMSRGEAMACPSCQVVLIKKWGCDWVKCSMCKTEICWVTRGARWGPAGKGDTSAGCQCGVNGVKCHPKCNYCH